MHTHIRMPHILKTYAVSLTLGLSVIGCSEDDKPLVQLMIEPPTFTLNGFVELKGTSFVPPGSSCPQSSELVRFGTLGPHEITYRNDTTGVTGPVFAGLWVCNSGDGRTLHWTSNPIRLNAGINRITVTMIAPDRTSSASIDVQGPG